MTDRRRELTAEAARRFVTGGPWLSCDDCFRYVDQYVDAVLARVAPAGATSGAPAPSAPADVPMSAMRAHLAGCPACCEEAESLLVLVAEDLAVDAEQALELLHQA